MAQQPAPPDKPVQSGATFKASTRLVVQTVTVKDKNGNPIEGLTAQDFTVTEDGEPQTIAFVEYQRLQGTAVETPATPRPIVPSATPAPVVSDVPSVLQAGIAAPPPGDTRFRDRRLIILYFDLSATSPTDQMRSFSAGLKYITTQMAPADMMAIMTFGGGAVRVKTDFTGDRAKLLETMNLMIYGKDEDGDGVRDPEDGSSAFGQGDEEFNIFNTDRQLAALQTAVGMLRPLPEQKSLVYFASNLRLNGTDNTAQLRATTNAAIRANVQIFPVDARGLVATAPLGDATQRSPGGVGVFTGQLAAAITTNFQRSQDALYSLAKDTGGKALFDYNDLSLGIVQAAQAQTSYYILGYYSTKIAADGKYRRIRVTLNGGRAADLTFRQGYYGDKEFARFTTADKERQLEEAFMLENPITEITIAMEMNYFQLTSAEYFIPVSVKIPGSELALARRRGAQRTQIDFIGEVKDEYGYTMQNVRDKLDIPLSDETASQLAKRPILYETGFTLLPGKYIVKILARDAETGRIGTYQGAFAVPNLEKEQKRVPISTVVLGSQRVPLSDALFSVKQKLDTQTTNPLVYDGQKLIPSVTRVFSKTRDMFVFLQAYQRGTTTMRPLVAFVAFYQGDQRLLQTQPLAVTDGLDARKAVPLRFSIPLESLAPGKYECQVTVLDPTSQKASFWQAPVAIVP
jgi:VWFA-related protein